MIAAILVTGLVLSLVGLWLLVEAMSFLHAGRRAFDRYTDTHPADLPRPAPLHPPTGSGSPHTTWRTKGSHEQ